MLGESLRIKYIGMRRKCVNVNDDEGFGEIKSIMVFRIIARTRIRIKVKPYIIMYDETSFDRLRIRRHVHFSRVIRGNRK